MARIATKVSLSESEKTELSSIIKKGTHKSRKITRARALLLMNSGKSRIEVQSELGIDSNHYYRIKKRYFAGGLSNALEERPRSGQPPIVTQRLEAQITSMACSESPAGSARWTLSLLNQKMVELNYVETISNESIRQVLKKAGLSLG
ncbi:helix-turn-helix domain-containing protein [Rhodocytophaga rosea]|uniref:Helix-turn-helix domain-containing protein n=1 Tax=Rhodocytophaga rosea TaxID=2704465 RepID=A0A6C0GMV2_9BACT|nr:helix-turn-helix domain-containing protein [Rhodocytophaga rosea]QHT67601.1 helix-turn-helix domain-containing protein [Rhodocytophaga rosea]QHT69174.1 helix-turn-helix domain-containing protein [Rhodocytophaga rosea]QHT71724.1 helix-turn-helix domain-containing protein [Rhodocytophaga rosea]QHT71809.1 helix-turn-helix domain-containing protein [Rhodocytophaga rosea]